MKRAFSGFLVQEICVIFHLPVRVTSCGLSGFESTALFFVLKILPEPSWTLLKQNISQIFITAAE